MQSPESIKKLKQLYLEKHRERYPQFPEGARTAPKYTDKDANSLTKCIIDYIKLTGGQAERISVTGRRIDKRKIFTDTVGYKRQIGRVQWVKSNMKKGSADISATIRGCSVKIEVKIGKDRQSKDQKQYQKEIEKAEGIYMIVRSFDDFLENLKYYGLNDMKNAIKK
ncbi:MAG: hypothetical protein K9J21_07150 [Bacteroidales bacterium]|nr:hypothetical protein [Bacteroidales bacterium]